MVMDKGIAIADYLSTTGNSTRYWSTPGVYSAPYKKLLETIKALLPLPTNNERTIYIHCFLFNA